MPERRRWLVLAHSFNMDGRAASQTVTDKVPYLLESGIELTVISAKTGTADKRFRHFQLLAWGPSGLRFDFRHMVANRFGRGIIYRILTSLVSVVLLPFIFLERLALGLSNHSSWAIPAAIYGTALVRREEFELLYSSGGAWCAHLAAAWIKRRTGIKWIAEVHDPMVIRDDENDDGTAPRDNRNDRFVQKLEGIICREADHAWWFTEPALQYARHRHPELAQKGFVVYPGAEAPEVEGIYVESDTLNICHFGSLTNDRSLSQVIYATASLIEQIPELSKDVRFEVYGTSMDDAARRACEETGLFGLVKDYGRLETDPVTGLSGRARVTKHMFEADVLLLLHGDYEWCAEYIPSKYYEYLWTRRPILAVTNRSDSLDRMLEQRNAYVCHTLDKASIEAAISRLYRDWKAHSLRQPSGEPVTVRSAVERILEHVS